MNGSSITCPACGISDISDLGPVSVNSGAVRLDDPGRIYQCAMCGIMFRRPYLSPACLIETYGAFSADYWNYTRRTDFDMTASTIVDSLPSGRVLDVGCYRGDFLAMLPDSYQKYGIEPAEAAREVARGRGIKLIGASLEGSEINAPMFHFITLLDVIEHLPYPLKSLQKIAKLLLPGGMLILSTGNTNALPWRLMRQDYWYYSTEHVSFFNPRWFRWAAKQLGLSFVVMKAFSHKESSAFEQWRQLAQCLAFIALKHLNKHPILQKMISSIYPFNRAICWTSPPLTHLWKDHMFVILKSMS